MNSYANSELYRLLTDLVKFRSVSPSREGENAIARFIFDTLSVQPYFRGHPEDVRLLPLDNDPLGRHFVFAVVRTPETTADTVLLAGHMDVGGFRHAVPSLHLLLIRRKYERIRLRISPLRSVKTSIRENGSSDGALPI